MCLLKKCEFTCAYRQSPFHYGSLEPIPADSVFALFLLQADFILTSSREGMLDCPWNVYLRDQLLCLLCDSLEILQQQQPSFRSSFLALLPLPGEVPASTFFCLWPQQLRDRFEKLPCAPTESGAWKRPSSVLLPCASWQQHDAPLVNNSMLLALTGLEYISSRVLQQSKGMQQRMEQVLANFGCVKFCGSHLVQCLTSPSASSHLQQLPASWLHSLYSLLGTHSSAFSADDWSKLQMAPIFRVHGSMTSSSSSSSKLMLWDEPHFSQHDWRLFERELWLERGSWGPDVQGLLSLRFKGISTASAAHLAQLLLQQYPTACSTSSKEVLDEHLFFFYRCVLITGLEVAGLVLVPFGSPLWLFFPNIRCVMPFCQRG